MIFGLKGMRDAISDTINLNTNGCDIALNKKVNNLGVIIDHLLCTSHVTYVCQKSYFALKGLHECKRITIKY